MKYGHKILLDISHKTVAIISISVLEQKTKIQKKIYHFKFLFFVYYDYFPESSKFFNERFKFWQFLRNQQKIADTTCTILNWEITWSTYLSN